MGEKEFSWKSSTELRENYEKKLKKEPQTMRRVMENLEKNKEIENRRLTLTKKQLFNDKRQTLTKKEINNHEIINSIKKNKKMKQELNIKTPFKRELETQHQMGISLETITPHKGVKLQNIRSFTDLKKTAQKLTVNKNEKTERKINFDQKSELDIQHHMNYMEKLDFEEGNEKQIKLEKEEKEEVTIDLDTVYKRDKYENEKYVPSELVKNILLNENIFF
jgi:hypothetical protein